MAAITEQLKIPSIKRELARIDFAEELKRSALKPETASGAWRSQPWLTLLFSLLLTSGLWFGLPQLNAHARIAFITFSLAIIGWSFTRINDTYIAIAAAITFAVVGIDEPEEFFETLGDATIWLLMAMAYASA